MDESASPDSPKKKAPGRVSLAELQDKTLSVSTILPISQSALEVFNLCNRLETDDREIARALARDPSLTVELLRLANSSFYNPTGEKVLDVKAAVTRLGQRRVGEVALATSALAGITAQSIPWMEVSLEWRRSIAAGIAIGALVSLGRHQRLEEGLLVASLMHSLGRIVLATLFPVHYERMLRESDDDKQSLLAKEREVFPESHAETLARLLEAWGLPLAAHQPLRSVCDDFTSLARLSEPTRTKVELVKLAILVARFAVGKWQPWDEVDLPSASVLARLRIPADAVESIVLQTRSDLLAYIARTGADDKACESSGGLAELTGPLAYASCSPGQFDFLGQMLKTFGLQLVDFPGEAADKRAGVVNCLDVSLSQLGLPAERESPERFTIVTDRRNSSHYRRFPNVLVLPDSVRSLYGSCEEIIGK